METQTHGRDRRCTVWPRLAASGIALAALLGGPSLAAGQDLTREIRLSGDPDPTTHYYRMTTEVVGIEPDGRRKAPEVYDLWLEYAPRPGAGGDLVTCRRFTVGLSALPAVTLPSLENWSYAFRPGHDGLDERGFIFGIDQARFEGLADARGEVLPLPGAYAVFNAFADFHSFGQVFARRTSEGKGIQDLHTIGQTVLHASAHSEPPISLGAMVAKGSSFKNGAITLELKGLSLVGGRRCALIGYDSGDSALRMTLKPMPQVTLEILGGSHYTGDLYVDLETQWLLKATLTEFVVSETSGAALPQKLASVIERRLLLRALGRAEFEASRSAGPTAPTTR
jgi:hypothetical protein